MSGEVIDLRKRAEDRIARRASSSGAAATSADALAHELEVHRIELDMQRDELEQQRSDAQASSDRFAEMCNLAPVGLLVIDTYSRILDGNVTAWQLLGLHLDFERSTELVLYLEFQHGMSLRAQLSRGQPAVLDVRIRPRRSSPFQALLALSPDPYQPGRFHAAITDTTARGIEGSSMAAPAPTDTVNVLVVEPYGSGRRALRDSLGELGYQIVDVEDSEHALRVSSEIAPSLLIADFQPARLDGITLINTLRSRWPELPAVLLCTAREEVTEIPSNSILLPKPITLSDLERAIAAIIGPRSPRA